ncbi:hypothetical protein [Saccharibacillus sp. JS10]|uniref:hypothetical protein n=1 Tax=Saccharibacillus sp. JS10 TaxID=2950552 RepID=UPI002109FCA6|nr:hypothetical protein [Saccharibacillus sp. JS10]MCQ4087903.1 hypothetical protein [Saccharibacillus sp. JS10]
MIKKKLVGLAGVLLLVAGGASAYAGTSYSGTESPTLPGGNGSAYSSSQIKASTLSADLLMNATQGYNIDVRTENVGGGNASAWARNVTGGTTRSIPSSQQVGSQVQLKFSADLFSPTTVINYRWRSN